MPKDIVGVLDVGSNSVRLLVAQLCGGRAISLHTEKITCRLLSGMREGWLSPQALERTARAIEDLAERARGLGAGGVYGFGTSAMRDGKNSGLLMARARACAVDLRVLSGEEEADLAYAGSAPKGRRGVIDIGGGSTEMLAGQDGRRLAAYSARIGSVRLCEAMSGEIDQPRMLQSARAALEAAWETVRPCPVDGWVGVGGTITSAAAICLALSPYDPEKVQDYPLDADAAHGQFHRLCGMSLEERRNLPGLNPVRADIIPFGCAILCAFFDLSGAPSLLVSDRDNLLGFLEKYPPG